MLISGTTVDLSSAKVSLFGAEIFWGRFSTSLLDFLFMAAVIYFIFKGLGLDKIDKPKEN